MNNRYEVISYLDNQNLPNKKRAVENQKYFGHIVIWDYSKSVVVDAQPYNVYHIDRMIGVARKWNRMHEDRKLYLQVIKDYAGGGKETAFYD